MAAYDVVTLGETMLRLTPPDQRRLEQTHHLEMHIGGSESNVAVGLARLGLKTAWVSRLTDNPIGRHIERTIAAQGVDTQHIIWTPQDRIGLYFLEEGTALRGGVVTYDRANSAMSRIRPDDLPAALFAPSQSRWLHLTGITPALSPDAAQTTLKAAQLAHQNGWGLSFDFNFRRLLWDGVQALAGCTPIAALANLLFIARRDACLFYQLPDDTPPEKVCAVLRQHFPSATLVVTLGAEGAMGCSPDGALYTQAVFPADPQGQVGRGDAFVVGFLREYLGAGTLDTALTWGAAAAALKSTIWGDMPLLNEAELVAAVGAKGSPSSILR